MTEDFKRKLTAILSADVVGYSRLMGEDEESTVRTINKYRKIIFELVERNKGRVIDSPGDNILTEFVSVVDAVRCGVQIQEDLKGHNDELPADRKMEFRIGIHTGDVIQDGDRIYGDGVNVAARIESLADPGGICVSSIAYEQVKKKLNYEYEHLGEYEVKNIDEPVSVYKVLMVSKTTDKVVEEKRMGGRTSLTRNIAIIVIVIIAGLLAWSFYPKQPKETEQTLTTPEVNEAPKSIAVLAFENLSPDPEQDYFVAGLSEEILNSLTQIPGLGVTARTSSFALKGKDKTVPEIASILGVDHILEGSVRKSGNTLRITAQLIRAANGLHLWSEEYDRELKDIFEIQEDIANNVAEKLKLTLEAYQLLGGTKNVEAYELFLSAKGHIYRDEENGALELIDKAIELDPEFALAWALKSDIHIFIAANGSPKLVEKEQDKALEAAQRAIKIEPNLAEAYGALGQCRLIRGDLIGAKSVLQKALELTNKPSSIGRYIGQHYHLVGYLEKANRQFEIVKQNDPFNEINRAFYIVSFGSLGKMQEAEKEYKRCLELFGEPWSGNWSISSCRLSDNKKLSRDDLLFLNGLFDLLKEKFESREDALSQIHQIYTDYDNLTNGNLVSVSMVVAYLGDSEFSMDALERASNIDKSRNSFIWMPVMKEVRQLPRFKEFVKEVGLVDYWKQYGWPDLCRPVGDDDFECD